MKERMVIFRFLSQTNANHFLIQETNTTPGFFFSGWIIYELPFNNVDTMAINIKRIQNLTQHFQTNTYGSNVETLTYESTMLQPCIIRNSLFNFLSLSSLFAASISSALSVLVVPMLYSSSR